MFECGAREMGVFNCYNFLTALRHAICQQPLTAGIAIWKIWYLAWILEKKMVQTIGAQASKISPIFERKTGSPCQPWFCLAVEIFRKTPPDGFEFIITCATKFHNTLYTCNVQFVALSFCLTLAKRFRIPFVEASLKCMAGQIEAGDKVLLEFFSLR